MKKKSKPIAVLAIGDRKDFDSFQKIEYRKEEFIQRGFRYYSTNYTKILKGQFPAIKEDRIVVFLFFPFLYWDKYIEHKNYRGVYGNKTFYKKFVHFWKRIERKLKKHYGKGKLYFINEPRRCARYRDKVAVIKKLKERRVPQPLVHDRSFAGIKRDFTNGTTFYIKPRFGSMGKGITYLSRKLWMTNFEFKRNKIVSRKSDYGWEFRYVTGNEEFLRQLLSKDMIVEKGVEHYVKKGSIIDLRIYTFLGEILYIYPRRNKCEQVTTNISQGGKGDPALLKSLPKGLLDKAKKEAIKVSKTLNLGLAGIDVIPDRTTKKAYVIDVNLFSGFPKLKTFNTAKYLAKKLKASIEDGTFDI